MNLPEKLQQLRAFFTANRGEAGDITSIDGWIEQARRLLLVQSLKGHAGIIFITEQFTTEVTAINEKLLRADSKELSDRERDRLLDRKHLATKFLSVFESVDENVERLEALADQEIVKK